MPQLCHHGFGNNKCPAVVGPFSPRCDCFRPVHSPSNASYTDVGWRIVVPNVSGADASCHAIANQTWQFSSESTGTSANRRTKSAPFSLLPVRGKHAISESGCSGIRAVCAEIPKEVQFHSISVRNISCPRPKRRFNYRIIHLVQPLLLPSYRCSRVRSLARGDIAQD